MTTRSQHRTLALLGIAVAAVIAVIVVNVLAAQPWNTTESALCAELSKRHLRAQVLFLEAGSGSQTALGAKRDTTYAALGMACGWEMAQAADMAGFTKLLAGGETLPAMQ
jgi:hypothetical protein